MVVNVSFPSALAAERSGAVGGIDEAAVRQREQLAMNRVVEAPAQIVGRPAERRAQVGTSDVADEERVAGEHRVRNRVAGVEVEHEHRDRLGRVPGRLERLEPDTSHLDGVPVAERREGVLGGRRSAQVDRRAGAVAKLEVSRDEVRVQVRQDDVCDPQLVLCGERQVLVDVTLRIDDGSDAGLFIGHDVRSVCEALQVKLLEDHAAKS